MITAQTGRRAKYEIRNKTAAQAALLAVGIVMVCLGVCRNEVATVLSKAIKLCLECVGIG